MRDPDALLLSYSKSGRTWLRFALANLFNLHADLKWDVDLQTFFDLIPNWEKFQDRAKTPDEIPLVCCSHDLWRSEWDGLPVIWLMRDPRDAMVSYWFHLTRHDPRKNMPSIEQFCDESIGGVIAHHRAVDQHAGDRLVVHYEGLHRNMEGHLARIANFIGIEPEPRHVKWAASMASFDRMTELEIERGLRRHERYDRREQDARRVRRGRVHGWREHLSAEHGARLMERFFAGIGSDLSDQYLKGNPEWVM